MDGCALARVATTTATTQLFRSMCVRNRQSRVRVPGERMADSLYGIRRPERSPRKAGQKRSPDGTAHHLARPPLSPPFSLPLSSFSRSAPPVGSLAVRVPFFCSWSSTSTSHPCSCLLQSSAMHSILSFVFLLATLLASRGAFPRRCIVERATG